MIDQDRVREHDQLKPFRESMAHTRDFMRSMMNFWFLIMPIVVLQGPLQTGLREGNWTAFYVMAPFAALVFYAAWKIRKLMFLLVDMQEREDQARDYTVVDQGEQARRRIERRERAERRLAAIHERQRQVEEQRRIADLRQLADDLSDTDIPPADN